LVESFLNEVLSFFLPAVSDKFLVKSIFICAYIWLFAKSKTPKIKIDFKMRNEKELMNEIKLLAIF
jgi:hypothetical protein